MENSATRETPMGRVWFIVAVSMCFTFGAALIWHATGVSVEERHNKITNDAVMQNTEQIARYRDVLKEKGKDVAANSLATSSQNIYGN